jgi:hypothetical protein
MKNKYYLIAIILFSISMSGCYYDIDEELYPSAINACDSIPATYSTKIQVLISGSCAISGCHTANGQSPNLSDYTNLKNNIERVKARAVQEKSMPPSSALSSCDVSALQQWIDKGALND